MWDQVIDFHTKLPRDPAKAKGKKDCGRKGKGKDRPEKLIVDQFMGMDRFLRLLAMWWKCSCAHPRQLRVQHSCLSLLVVHLCHIDAG